MNDSRNKAVRTAQVRAEWRRPEVRRVRAGAAELTNADAGGDIVFS